MVNIRGHAARQSRMNISIRRAAGLAWKISCNTFMAVRATHASAFIAVGCAVTQERGTERVTEVNSGK